MSWLSSKFSKFSRDGKKESSKPKYGIKAEYNNIWKQLPVD